MSPRFLLCAVTLFWAASALAQSASTKPPHPATTSPPAVAPDDLVIQISGACQTPPGEFAVRDCIRGVTREEFDALVAATNPNATEGDREKLAENVGRLIILSNEARKRGLPKDPKVHELLRMLQIQELASLLLSQSEQQAAAGLSDPEIESFYQSHMADFQSAELIRLTIPRTNTDVASPEDAAYAESIRTRCSAGEDPAKLQSESFQRASHDMKEPEDLKNQKRAQYKESEQLIFGLKPGECAVIANDKGDFHLYKMIRMVTPSIVEVRGAIVQKMKSERVKNDLDGLVKQHAIRLNNKYFPAAPPTDSLQK